MESCGCLPEVHTGPHWLHMDTLTRCQNEALIRHAIATGNGVLFERGLGMEIQRLREKAMVLEREDRKNDEGT